MIDFRATFEEFVRQKISNRPIGSLVEDAMDALILKISAESLLKDLESIDLENDQAWQEAKNLAWQEEKHHYFAQP